jgi:hypothetical protein
MSRGKEKNMGQVRWASWMVGLVMALAVCGVRPVSADIRSDQAAAIVEWPSVEFFEFDDFMLDTGFFLDTIIQLSNTSTDPVIAWCFYENANSHCSNSGEVCVFAEECCSMETGCGQCVPGWNETDFHVHLTPRQPLGWLASEGMAGFDPSSRPPKDFGKFPLDGVTLSGIGGSSNAGSRIPPVPESPFIGSLRCIAVDDADTPVDRNVLKGEATIVLFGAEEGPDDQDIVIVAKANAIGIQAIPGAVNDDHVLVLGGPEPEYNGCPNILILNHFFDGAVEPVILEESEEPDDDTFILTLLTLVPCTQDFLRQIPGAATVQYLVYNEFEQRLSTSRSFQCKQLILLSNIDTPQNERSIFSAGVQGTLTGQTRMNSVEPGSGILGLATEIHVGDTGIADFNLHYQGDRVTPDIITLP